MRRSLALTLCLLSGCASQHEASRAEDSADRARGTDAGAWLADAAPAHDALAASVDASARNDAQISAAIGASDASESDAGACGLRPVTCAVEDVDLHFMTARGALHLTQVGLDYWAGFSNGTALFARGELAGSPIELRARVFMFKFPEDLGPAAPPGDYEVLRDGGIGTQLYARVDECQRSTDLSRARLQVDVHEGPPPGPLSQWAGAPIRFQGLLTIDEPGWELSVPMSVSKVCEASVDL